MGRRKISNGYIYINGNRALLADLQDKSPTPIDLVYMGLADIIPEIGLAGRPWSGGNNTYRN